MTELSFLDKPSVVLLDHMGTDLDIARAAWVSTSREEDDGDVTRIAGLIRYLLEHKHGTPFEHASLKFYVSAPIFTFREFHRHRIGFSYNEMSGRYTELYPEFYVQSSERPMVNVGSSARPRHEPGTHEQYLEDVEDVKTQYASAWACYKRRLERGVTKELARTVLPVGIYSRMQVTTNPRALMHFLSLRTDDPRAKFPSHPQYEIEQVAKIMEASLEQLFPLTYAAYIQSGRVAP